MDDRRTNPACAANIEYFSFDSPDIHKKAYTHTQTLAHKQRNTRTSSKCKQCTAMSCALGCIAFLLD